MVNILIGAGVNIDSTSEISTDDEDDFWARYENTDDEDDLLSLYEYTDTDDEDDFDSVLRLYLDGPPSFFAAANGLVDVLERLLSLGSNVNFANQEKLTALMFASCARPSVRSAVISVLLKYGADVNARDRFGRSALFYLLFSEHTESMTESAKLLLNAGAEMNILCTSLTAPREESLLWHACEKGDFLMVDLFISYDLDLKSEAWLTEIDRCPKKLTENHEQLQYLLGEFGKVDDLKVICRRRLHNLLGKARVYNIGCLGLPDYLKGYLLYSYC